MNRALLLILDGFGVGAMTDAPPQQAGAHTLRHVWQETGVALPALFRLGLERFLSEDPPGNAQISRFRAPLGHVGADTYLGHNELLGVMPPVPKPCRVQDEAGRLVPLLRKAGLEAEPIEGGRAIWIRPGILVADNLEAEPGNAINVSGCLDVVDFATVVQASEVARSALTVSRVIGLGAPQIDPGALRLSVHTRGAQTGIDTAHVGFYRPGYIVRHFGLPIDGRRELPHRVQASHAPVHLLGKVADVAADAGDAIDRQPIVETGAVLKSIDEVFKGMGQGLVVATVQETDLAGHAEDSHRYAEVLAQVDAWLSRRLKALAPGDLLVVTADHGNDPKFGPRHTREYVPVLRAGRNLELRTDGYRNLCDVGDEIARHLGLSPDAVETSHLS